MDKKDFEAFLTKHDLSNQEFATIIGVTPAAVAHWLNGTRSLSLTTSRLIRLFDKKPILMQEFGR